MTEAQPGKSLDAEFDDFERQRTRIRCATCKLPPEVRAWAETKHAEGASMAAIVQFLNGKGYQFTASAFKNHLDNLEQHRAVG